MRKRLPSVARRLRDLPIAVDVAPLLDVESAAVRAVKAAAMVKMVVIMNGDLFYLFRCDTRVVRVPRRQVRLRK